VRDLSRLGPDAIDGHLSSSVYFSSLNSPENAAFIHACAQSFPDGPVSSADAESSCIDRQTFRAWLTPRIGRSAANGQFEVLLESREPIAPDPYLVQPSPRFASSRVPIGRKYFNCHRLADLSNTELVIDGRNPVVPGGSSVSRYQLRQPFADMDILVRPIARGQCADHGAAHPWALARFDHRTRGEACGVTGGYLDPEPARKFCCR